MVDQGKLTKASGKMRKIKALSDVRKLTIFIEKCAARVVNKTFNVKSNF